MLLNMLFILQVIQEVLNNIQGRKKIQIIGSIIIILQI